MIKGPDPSTFLNVSPVFDRRKFLVGACGLAAGIPVYPRKLFGADKVIKIAYSTTFVPLSFLDENGKMTGAYVDLFDEILGKKMGFQLEHIGLPWKRAQKMVEIGEADAFCTNATDRRRDYMNFCEEEVIENFRAAIFRKGSPLDVGSNIPLTLEELKHLHHASYIGNGWAKRQLEDFDVYWAPESNSAMKLVAFGRADVFVSGVYQARFKSKELGLNDKLGYRKITVGKPSLHRFGMRKTYAGSDGVVTDFCHHWADLKDGGQFNELVRTYVG